MKKFFSLIALLFATLPAFSQPTALIADPPAAQVGGVGAKQRAASKDATWYAARVEVERAPGTTAVGSGTPIYSDNGKTLVLTNAHVVRDDTKPVTVVLDGKRHPAKYVSGSEVRDVDQNTIAVDGPDLCLLEVEADLDYVGFAEADAKPGAEVFQHGYGGSSDGKPILRSGQVLREHFVGQLNSDVGSVQGDSGSGVFDKYGLLVGVCHGGTETVSIAERVTTVTTFTTKSERVFRLFPRLRARLEARKTANAAMQPPEPPMAVTPALPKAPAPKTSPKAPVGHTHTCPKGHTFDHTMDGGTHRCPYPGCGLPQYVQDPYPRTVYPQTPTYITLPGTSFGGCPNGSCSVPQRSGLFRR